MARKKKVKIIKEQVREQFKEIKSEEKSQEGEPEEKEGLEEIASSGSEDFSSSSGGAQVLKSSGEVQEAENLEETARKAPAASSDSETEQRTYDPMIYNQPNYSSSAEEQVVREMRKTKTFIDNVQQTTPTRVISDWEPSELQESRKQSHEPVRQYMVDLEKSEREEKKLPFQERRKYRDLRK